MVNHVDIVNPPWLNNAMTSNTTPLPTPTTGSAIVAAIEAFWAAIVQRHPELPSEVVVITGSGAVRGGLIRGRWATAQWRTTGGRLPELFVSGERMDDGAEGVAATVLHEAAHALLQARGDDTLGTSRQGRYHNGRFVAAAEELGLQGPKSPDPILGFSNCTITNETVAEYAAEIVELALALGASIEWVTIEKLRSAALAVGWIMGGLVTIVPWWRQDDPVAMWGVLGGGVRAPRATRTRRPRVVLQCGCRIVHVRHDEAADWLDLDCRRCGEALTER